MEQCVDGTVFVNTEKSWTHAQHTGSHGSAGDGGSFSNVSSYFSKEECVSKLFSYVKIVLKKEGLIYKRHY